MRDGDTLRVQKSARIQDAVWHSVGSGNEDLCIDLDDPGHCIEVGDVDVIASKGAKGRWVLDAPELRIKELLETITQATPFLCMYVLDNKISSGLWP